jgi:uncharacterized membrane protein YeiH
MAFEFRVPWSADPGQLVPVIEFLAVVAAAVYGVLRAARQGMDLVGVFTVACVVSFGGGTLRDLFLDRHPLFWIANPHYVAVVLGIAVAGGLIVRHVRHLRPLLLVPDALGMGLFTMAGTSIALESGAHPFLAAILGTITGTFGGVLGDIVCNEIPTLFRPAPLCATCSFAGAVIWLGLRPLGWNEPASMITGAAVVVLLRLAAVRWNWQLPALRPPSW